MDLHHALLTYFTDQDLLQKSKEQRLKAQAKATEIIKEVFEGKRPPVPKQECIFSVQQFGSTVLGVDNVKSDLDLLVCSFDSLYDRKTFFVALERALTKRSDADEIVVVQAANVPVVKFKIDKVSVDLTFSEFKTPQQPVPEDYFFQSANVSHHDQKSLECMNGFLMMRELKGIIENFDRAKKHEPLELFKRCVFVVKWWCQSKGIYSYKLGYLNGIAIMMMVCHTMEKVYP